MKYKTENVKDTEKLADILIEKVSARKDLAEKKEATIVTLSGDLGAGKTTFVQNVAKTLGIKSKILSPTFVLMKRYSLAQSRTSGEYENLYHIDAYRLEGKDIPHELNLLKFEEILNNPKNIIFIEWPEILKGYLPEKVFKIKIKHKGANSREVFFS